MTKELANNHSTDLTPDQIRLLRRQRGLHPVWKYVGDGRATFELDGETYLDLIQGNPIRTGYEPDDDDFNELKSLMEREPGR